MLLVLLLLKKNDNNDRILRFFLCIPASAADAAALNPKGIKTPLANGLITFFVNGNPVFSNAPRNQQILLILSS